MNLDAKLDALIKIMQQRDERMEEIFVGISKDVLAMRHILQSVLDNLTGPTGPGLPDDDPMAGEMLGENLYPLSATALANAPLDQQRRMLGENLYPLVKKLQPDSAAKVTEMLLEMDKPEVLHLLESTEALKAKVSEAMVVLRTVQQHLLESPEAEIEDLSSQLQTLAAEQFKAPDMSKPETSATAQGDEEAYIELVMARAGVSRLEALMALKATNADIELVMTQAFVSRSKALRALKDAEGDIVSAIMELTS